MSDFEDAVKRVITPINKDGYFIIGVSVVITLFLMLISSFLGGIALILTLFIIYFFRDPERIISDDKDSIVASADGVVDKIEEVEAPKELELKNKKFKRVSIFLSTFNVHIQRMPYSGKITKSIYIKGKYLNITNDKYHEDNERQIYLMKTDNNLEIAFVQIAGMVARRIVSYIKEGDELNKGEKFGSIKFGSRVDVYLPKNVDIKVKVGQTMIAGETVIGVINNKVNNK